MLALLREGMEEGAFGLSSGLDYPPGSYATTGELAELTQGGRPARRLLPHPRPLLARRPLPRSVPGGDRDRPARRGARPHHPLLSPQDVPGQPRPDARARRRRPQGRPRRHVRRLPGRVGEHPAPDPDPDRGSRPAARSGPRSGWPSRAVRNRIRRELQERGQLFAGAGGLRDVRIGYLHGSRSCCRGRAGRSAS